MKISSIIQSFSPIKNVISKKIAAQFQQNPKITQNSSEILALYNKGSIEKSKIYTITDLNGNPKNVIGKIKNGAICILDEKGSNLGLALYGPAYKTSEDYYPSWVLDYIQDGALHVNMMYSNATDKYKGVGKLLHKLLVQESINRGFEGRVFLEAAYDSHCFHYKCGFRPINPKNKGLSEKIEEYVKIAEQTGKRQDTNKFFTVDMAITPEGIEKLLS